jgi:hypothetical protein
MDINATHTCSGCGRDILSVPGLGYILRRCDTGACADCATDKLSLMNPFFPGCTGNRYIIFTWSLLRWVHVRIERG